MDRTVAREIEHLKLRIRELEDRTRNIPLRPASAGAGGSGDVNYYTGIPEEVGIVGSAGTSNNVSRGNHSHIYIAEGLPEEVEELPDIPTEGMKEVYWTSTGFGVGDDQIWRAYAGQEEWTPTQLLTDKSGAPPAT